MAILQYSLNASSWTAITAAGESGSAWLDEEGDGNLGHADARIYHSSTPPGDAEVTMGKKIYRPAGNSDIMLLGADDASDIFYGRCVNDDDRATVTVDVI